VFRMLSTIIGLRAAVTFMLFAAMNLVSPMARALKEEMGVYAQESDNVQLS